MSTEKSCINVFLDEQLSSKKLIGLLQDLNNLMGDCKLCISSLDDKDLELQKGMADHIWTEKLKEDSRNWIILSFDRGRKRKNTPLPKLCEIKQLHYISFSQNIKENLDIYRAIIYLLPKFKSLSNTTSTKNRYSLDMKSDNIAKSIFTLKIVKKN
jgi:hypothetical protein